MRSKARLIAAVLVVASLHPAVAEATSGFDDVPSGSFYEDAVAWLVENEITIGVEPGCFAPREIVTRGQLAAFLFRLEAALGGVPSGTAHPFSDVFSPYQQEPVAWMHENGITTGTSPVTYSPEDPVTRGQFAALLWRYAGRPAAASPHPFVDVVRDWQQDAVSWMAESGVTTGTTTATFSPDDVMTRAQAAAFMWRFAGSPQPTALPVEDEPCSRELRLALISGGLTQAEAACSISYLEAFSVEELANVLIGATTPSVDLIVAVSVAANNCLTPDRVKELTSLLF